MCVGRRSHLVLHSILVPRTEAVQLAVTNFKDQLWMVKLFGGQRKHHVGAAAVIHSAALHNGSSKVLFRRAE